MLPASTPHSMSSVLPCSAHSLAGATSASQSTTLPRKLNNSASKAPITAVASVMPAMYGRMPFVQCQTKANNPFGGVTGSASGYGWTNFSKALNTPRG